MQPLEFARYTGRRYLAFVFSFEGEALMLFAIEGPPNSSLEGLFKSFASQTPQHVCPGNIPRRSQQRAQLLVGEEGFRSSLVRTAKPLWLLHNPLQHIMRIMAAQWAFVTSQGRLMWGSLVHISSLLCFSNAASANLRLLALVFPCCVFPLSISLSHSHLPSPLSDVWEDVRGGWWVGAGEEISGDYDCLENTGGFVRHRRSWMLCQPALD